MDAQFAYICGSYYAPTHSATFLETFADKFGVFMLDSDQTDQLSSGEVVKCRYMASTNRVGDERWFFFSEDNLRYHPMYTTTFRGLSASGIIIAFNWFEYHLYAEAMRDVLHALQFAWCEALPVGIMVDVAAPRELLKTYTSNGLQICAGSRTLTEAERSDYVRPSTRKVDDFVKSHAWICPYQIVNLDNPRAAFDAVTRLLLKFDLE